jgi:hypothetical protein
MNKFSKEKSSLIARLAVDRERLNDAFVQLEKPFEKTIYFLRGAFSPPTKSLRSSLARHVAARAPQTLKWPVRIWRGFRAISQKRHLHAK